MEQRLPDDSITSSILAANVPVSFFKRLAAWLSLYTQNVFLRDKVEGLQMAGPPISSADLTEAITDSKTVEINELGCRTKTNKIQPCSTSIHCLKNAGASLTRSSARRVARHSYEFLRSSGPDLRRCCGSAPKREKRDAD